MATIEADETNAQCEYIAAQCAAAETLEIGRGTLAQAQQQSQQLQRASGVAGDTQYQLDQAARLLKNMTWTGWLANKLTREPALNSRSSNDHTILLSSSTWDKLDDDLSEYPLVSAIPPESCREAFQAIQNYRANLKVLQECEQAELLETCETICLAMYKTAMQQLQKVPTQRDTQQRLCDRNNGGNKEQNLVGGEERAFRLFLDNRLQQLRQRQSQILEHHKKRLFPQRNIKETPPDSLARLNAVLDRDNQSNSAQAATSGASQAHPTARPSRFNLEQFQKQDDHLRFLSTSLEEISYLSRNLQETVQVSNLTMDELEKQSDNILLQTKHVTRRADRLARQKNSSGWFRGGGNGTSLQSMLGKFVLRHAASGYFLSSCPTSGVRLRPDFDKASCLMGLYTTSSNAKERKIQTSSGPAGLGSPGYGLIGIKNLATNTWMGQSFLGTLDASATAPGHRQEWELDDGITFEPSTSVRVAGAARIAGETRLLCASAGWGSGGYLMVGQAPHRVLTLGGSGVDDKKKAAIWSLIIVW